MKFSAADIDAMLAVTGISAMLSPALELPKAITVKFRRNGIDAMGMLTDKPQAVCKESDFDGIDYRNCQIEINSTTYRISRPRPDDAGFVFIDLTRL
ncbi:MAG: hypothetical protein PHN84_03290 [Desulfuromonadaceae bacterium]|nr:hypothetical protein [Desulfuromonadaceae bacterium]